MHSTSQEPLESLSGLMTKVRRWDPGLQAGTQELSPEGPNPLSWERQHLHGSY